VVEINDFMARVKLDARTPQQAPNNYINL
jgi:hypothetical protein